MRMGGSGEKRKKGIEENEEGRECWQGGDCRVRVEWRAYASYCSVAKESELEVFLVIDVSSQSVHSRHSERDRENTINYGTISQNSFYICVQ
jgi:hypothetical protein